MHSQTCDPLTVGKAAFKTFRELKGMTPSYIVYRKYGSGEGLSKTDFWLCDLTHSPKAGLRQPKH